MPMTEKELLERDVKRNLGDELLQSVKEMRAEKVGHAHEVNIPEVIEARNKVFHIDSMGIEAGKHALKDPAIQSMLQQLKDPTSELSQKLKAAQAIDPAIHKLALGWKERLALNNGLIDQFNSPAYATKIAKAQHINKLITPAYIESAKTALGAFNGDLRHKDMLSRIHGYTTATEQILTLGINAQIARDMLGPHKALLETYRSWEIPKPKKKGKKFWKKKAKEVGKTKAKELEEKDIKHAKELAELQSKLDHVLESQNKEIEKQSRENQLHTLIWKIDQHLQSKGNKKPESKIVLRELINNHYEYDDDAIILSVKNGAIEWRSRYGKEQCLSMTSFASTLSTVRKNQNN